MPIIKWFFRVRNALNPFVKALKKDVAPVGATSFFYTVL